MPTPLKTALLPAAALLVAGCASAPAEPERWLENMARSVRTVSHDTLVGTATGAFAGVAVTAQGCTDARICAPIAAVTAAGGAVIGGAKGLERGLARAQRHWQPAE
jgi:hypothetical protein